MIVISFVAIQNVASVKLHSISAFLFDFKKCTNLLFDVRCLSEVKSMRINWCHSIHEVRSYILGNFQVFQSFQFISLSWWYEYKKILFNASCATIQKSRSAAAARVFNNGRVFPECCRSQHSAIHCSQDQVWGTFLTFLMGFLWQWTVVGYLQNSLLFE